MTQSYQTLIHKLDRFIRQYYHKLVVKGVLLSFAIALAYILFISLAEYYGRFSASLRMIIFYASLFALGLVFTVLILTPLLKLFNIGRRISKEQAAGIISQHFSHIEDRLHNTLELAEMAEKDPVSRELIIAAIEERTLQMRSLNFTLAVNFRENLKHLRTLGLVLLLLATAYWVSPGIIEEAPARILNYNQEYEKEMPFEFILLNDSLMVEKGSDYTVKLKIRGEYVPANTWINIGGNQFLMKRGKTNEFEYEIKNVNKGLDFHFEGDEYRSRKYRLRTLATPVILDFKLRIDPPAYTGETSRTLENVGNATVPYGSRLSWSFKSKYADELSLRFADTLLSALGTPTGDHSLSRTAYQGGRYSINLKNENFEKRDILEYDIDVVPDLYPRIDLESLKDSTEKSLVYFRGTINDDYGFSKLTFNCIYGEGEDSLLQYPLNIQYNVLIQDYYYVFDFSDIGSNDEGLVKYYFEVSDNDGVNGAKTTRTRIYTFRIPTREEMEEMRNEAGKNAQEKAEKAQELAKELKNELTELRENLLNNQLTDWQREQAMQEINQKHQQLEELLNSMKEEMQKSQELSKQDPKQNEEIRAKQEQLEKLMESLIDEELKELIEKFNKMMENFDKNQMNQMMEKMDMSYEEVEKNLDRNLELMKKMQIKDKYYQSIEKLDELAKEQEELARQNEELNQKNEEETSDNENTEQNSENQDNKENENAEQNEDNSENEQDGEQKENNKTLSEEEIRKRQEELKEAYEKLQKEYEKMLEENKEMKHPYKIDKNEKEREEIEKNFEKIDQGMKQSPNPQNNKKEKQQENENIKNQKKNAEDMKKLSEKMSSMMQMNMAQQQEENLDDLRQLMDNLLEFSFDQELQLEEIQTVMARDPRYVELMNKQQEQLKNFEIIRDSLEALSMRLYQIGPTISKEVDNITYQLDRAKKELEERSTVNAGRAEQEAMASANRLILLLDEMMDQMLENMKKQQSGGGMCSKPKSGKEQSQQAQKMLEKMRQETESLKESLKQMMEEMEKQGKQQGKNDGGKEDGGKEKGGNKPSSEDLAKMLAKQEKMQQMIMEMMNQPGGVSGEAQRLLEEINRLMEQNNEDFVNQHITPQTLLRQKMILTRMLEAEEAEKEREIDKKRESREAKEHERSNPKDFFQYKRNEENVQENINRNVIYLNSFYKNKYKEYILKLNEND